MLPRRQLLAAGWTPGPLLASVLVIFCIYPMTCCLMVVGITFLRMGVAFYATHNVPDRATVPASITLAPDPA